jgi:hypothetical protein
MFTHYITSYFISLAQHQLNKRRMYVKSIERNRNCFFWRLDGAGVSQIVAAQIFRPLTALSLS